MPIGEGLLFTGSMVIGQSDLYIDGIDLFDERHPLYTEYKDFHSCVPIQSGYNQWYRDLPIYPEYLEEDEVEDIAHKDDQHYWPFVDNLKYTCDCDSASEDDSDDGEYEYMV